MGRPKLDRIVLQVRVAQDTSSKLKEMALELGYQYGADGNTGKFLDAIASVPVEKLGKLLSSDNTSHVSS